jgi:rubrerythrin
MDALWKEVTIMHKSAEKSEEFLNMIKEWQGLEEKTIAFSEDLMSRADNPLIKTTMQMIKDDSEKHKVMLQMIIDNLTKEALRLTPDDLIPLSDALSEHLEAEAKSVELAKSALKSSKLFVSQYILSYILADEEKHHALLSKLDEVKKATVFVT